MDLQPFHLGISPLFLRICLGLLASSLIAWLSYSRKSLSKSGSITAALIGALLYTTGTVVWYGALLAFFISSSLLSKLKTPDKSKMEALFEKSGPRDAGQVLANGGLPTLVCVLHFIWPASFWWPIYLGLLSTVNADTWATEIGTWLKGTPRSLLTFKKVPPGTSGGVSPSGTLAALAGALFIGFFGFVQIGSYDSAIDLLFITAIGGFLGALADSLLGATVQAQYRCSVCEALVESSMHHQIPSKRIKGYAFMTNDVVNLLSSLIGSSICLILYFFLAHP